MEPTRSLYTGDRVPWHQMEETLTEVRRRWFGAHVERLPVGTLITERQGDLLIWEAPPGEQVASWLTWALRRRIYVVETGLTRPHDLSVRLHHSGYRLAQSQGTYLYLPEEAVPPRTVRSGRTLLGWLRPRLRPAQAQVQVQEIDARALPTWNQVCWQAFGSRGSSELESLAEKRGAFQNLGPAAHWYLAWVDGRPVGTTILFEGDLAGQILAVGTVSAARRRGVAAALVRHAVAVHQADHHTPLFLDTLPGSGAEQLYLGLGFVPAYLRQTYAPPPLP